MTEYLINDKNKEQFKTSLLQALNSDSEELKNKLNLELLETYVNNVYLKENSSNLLDSFIVKLSKHKELFNKYISNIINLSYNNYLDKVTMLLKDKKNKSIIQEYVINNLDIIDFENEIELEIASIHAKNILKDKLNKQENLIWFISYLLKKESFEHKINPVIKFIYINKSNFCLSYNSKYKIYSELELANKYNNTITINLSIYNLLRKKDFKVFLIKLLNELFYKLQRIIETSKENNVIYNLETYNLVKETIIYSENNDKLALLRSNPLLDNFGLKELLLDNEMTQDKNYDLEEYFDAVLMNNPIILEKYPILKLEYNDTGYKKTLRELLDIKIQKLEYFNNQIHEYNKILTETDNEIIINNITSKLDELNNGLKDINTFHNTIIYKSLSILGILDLNKLLSRMSDKEVVSLKEAVLEEKENIIIKIENNRRKIFKTSTFLKQEELLTKEYSKVARYESKISDFQKENGSL